ncbi:MAG: purine base/nucleoside efflux pump PbuE [Rhodobacteraceae bacterium HLUCCA08]|nr:MAG: purine base/nucleoside efflux pump PbuE [Rhodobacteraceae bacterium HLUCCA08]
MSDEIWKRDEIESPCIKVCVVHPVERLCTGCLRSIEEITAWSRMTPETRAQIMAELPDRAGRLKQRRGGRAARLERG